MIQPTHNNVLIKVKHKYIKNITSILKRAAIQNGASVDPNECVNILGEVIMLPKKITNDNTHKGYTIDGIKIGDTAIFSYQVIYDLISTELETPFYRNMIFYKGEEYFVADITKIFGVIRNEEIIMINGYVMTTAFRENVIIVPQSAKKIKGTVYANIISIGATKNGGVGINANKGDLVYFSPLYAQKYQINDKPFCIIKQNRILGVDVV